MSAIQCIQPETFAHRTITYFFVEHVPNRMRCDVMWYDDVGENDEMIRTSTRNEIKSMNEGQEKGRQTVLVHRSRPAFFTECDPSTASENDQASRDRDPIRDRSEEQQLPCQRENNLEVRHGSGASS